MFWGLQGAVEKTVVSSGPDLPGLWGVEMAHHVPPVFQLATGALPVVPGFCDHPLQRVLCVVFGLTELTQLLGR